MGIDVRWKPKLHEMYNIVRPNPPDNFYESTDLLIEDMEICIYHLTTAITKWSEIIERCSKKITSYLQHFPNLHTIVLMFDEGKYVPINKRIEQEERVKNGELPLKTEEINNLIINDETEVDRTNSFLERVLNTREAKNKIFSYIIYSILKIQWKRNVKIIIDGAHMENIYKDEQLKSSLLFECNPTNEQKYIEMYNQFTNDDIYSCFIKVKDSTQIGESDLKVCKHLYDYKDYNQSKGSTAYVITKDSDSINILLLATRDLITKRNLDYSDSVEFNLILNISSKSPSKAIFEYIDIITLWRTIKADFSMNFPQICSPIETFVFLTMISKTDYVPKHNQITPANIWKAFIEGGHLILFSKDEQGSLSDIKIPSRSILRKGQEYGNVNRKHRYHLEFEESNIRKFIIWIYGYILAKTNEKVETDVHKIREKANQRDSQLSEKSTKSFKMPSDNEITTWIRMIWWQMDYLINGAREWPFLLPIAEDPQTSTSYFGWKMVNGKVIRTKEVVPLKRMIELLDGSLKK